MTGQQELVRKFEDLFGSGGDIRLFFAPGRVNLIGDHTDYNGGHTFPCALKMGFTAAVRQRSDQQICLSSMLLDPGTVFRYDLQSQNELSTRRATSDWVRPFLDMVRVFEEMGYMIPTGFDMLLDGDIPDGTGLGVIGSLEALIAVSLRGVYEYKDIGNRELLEFCRKIDGIYTGINSGIIRSCASLMGREGYGLFISSQKLQYEFVPLEMKNAVFLLTDSRIRQKLTREMFFQRKTERETVSVRKDKAAIPETFFYEGYLSAQPGKWLMPVRIVSTHAGKRSFYETDPGKNIREKLLMIRFR